jgi:hypothetical protein
VTPNFRVLGASVIGTEHVRLRRNNQDALRHESLDYGGTHYEIGVICDGCSVKKGTGSINEVGANLLSTYVLGEVSNMIRLGMAITEIPDALFSRCIGYLRSIASLTMLGNSEATLPFIVNHLLCTCHGFVMDEKECIIFSAGDGVIIVNDDINVIDQNNESFYLAYHLVERRYLRDVGAKLPSAFEVKKYDVADIQRLAIGTDGLTRESMEVIWGNASSFLLKRRFNVLQRTHVQRETMFDDCTAIVVERLPDEPVEELGGRT